MLYFSIESEDRPLEKEQIRNALIAAIESAGNGKPLFIIPPDISRLHSGAGLISQIIWEEYKDKVEAVLPATGTHKAMTGEEIRLMYGSMPPGLFREHDCRRDIVTLGKIPGSYISEASVGMLNYDWPVQVNRLIARNTKSLIISVGQVVPHEVTGMANYNKNIFIGCGGYESLNKSHFLSAVCGIENIMGKAQNPVRGIINRGESLFASHLNILYVLTVVDTAPDGSHGIKGLFTGTDIECFNRASRLSLKLNLKSPDRAPSKVLVYLDPAIYRSTWLGNKAIYRTRMAIADEGELVIMAPGVRSFGEDEIIDSLIRKYGYRPSKEILKLVEENADLQENLGAAAHLIHGSPENRFRVTYCTGGLDEKTIRNVGFNYADLEKTEQRFRIGNLQEGYNISTEGEEFYYIPNPGMGLWSITGRIKE
jgi:nickel-dependent lactate racemase